MVSSGHHQMSSRGWVVTVENSTIVRPATETPRHGLWCSNLDLLVPSNHTPSVHFYKPNGSKNFFDTKILKETLSRALVPFYPLAGRLGKNKDDRTEINCNGQGALFVEAVTDIKLDDLGDFASATEHIELVPKVDYTQDMSSFPLLLVQVTTFKCGGICLGISIHHYAADGHSGPHFVNSWSAIARGADAISRPFMDRIILSARNPPRPAFPHLEFQPGPSLKTKIGSNIQPQEPQNNFHSVRRFKITKEQMMILKSKAKQGDNSMSYTTFETLAGHIWRCACKARKLDHDQQTTVFITVNGRSRLKPNLPKGYFGNAIFSAAPVAESGELTSRPPHYAASKVHGALMRMDDEYLRSAIDYLELQPNLSALFSDMTPFGCPNLVINSWARLSMDGADFGWGRPFFISSVGKQYDGCTVILPSPLNDDSVTVAIALPPEHMSEFEKVIYDI